MPDACYPRCRLRSRRYVCPRNGEPVVCPEAREPLEHHREELVRDGGRIPECVTHGIRLERSQ